MMKLKTLFQDEDFKAGEVPNYLNEFDKKIREFYELAPLTDKKGE